MSRKVVVPMLPTFTGLAAVMSAHLPEMGAPATPDVGIAGWFVLGAGVLLALLSGVSHALNEATKRRLLRHLAAKAAPAEVAGMFASLVQTMDSRGPSSPDEEQRRL